MNANDLGPDLIQMHRTKLSDQLRRARQAIEQLGDNDVNWRPNAESNSVANLVVHIAGNLHERLATGIGGAAYSRDREAEFDLAVSYTQAEVLQILDAATEEAEAVLSQLGAERLGEPQYIRDRQVTVLEVLFTIVTHIPEHVGQILYIAKLRLGGSFRNLSVPRGASHRRQ